MKTYNKVQYDVNVIHEKINEIAYFSYDFNKTPPVIGIILADIYGNALMVFEYSLEESSYGPIKSYLKSENDNQIEIDINLISGYLSAFKSFSGEINIQNLENLEIGGSNIKVQIHFLFDQYMIIIFLNSNIDLSSRRKAGIMKYFEEKLVKYETEFKHFNAAKSREIIQILEKNGKYWLKNLNESLIQSHRTNCLQRHLIIDDLVDGFNSIIHKELFEYLPNAPEDILDNLSREIDNKIQDRLFENLTKKND